MAGEGSCAVAVGGYEGGMYTEKEVRKGAWEALPR